MIGVAAAERSAKVWQDYIAKQQMAWPQYLDSVRDNRAVRAVRPARPQSVADTFGVGG